MPFTQSELPTGGVKPKTFKREVATAMLGLVFGGFIWGVWEPQAMDAAKHLSAPVFLFAGGAFGLDAFSKQFQR